MKKNSKVLAVVDWINSDDGIKIISTVVVVIGLFIGLVAITTKSSIGDVKVPDDTEIESDKQQVVVSSAMTMYDLPVVLPSSDTDTEQEDLSAYNITHKIVGSEPYDDIITIYTDLLNRENISETQINKIIDALCDSNGHKASNFKGTGDAFIYASQITGYDPIFLVSLALNMSNFNATKTNDDVYDVYDIGDCDSGYIGDSTGDTISQSIINGAMYIKEEYYDWNWETTICDMCYGSGGLFYGHSNSDQWAYNVASTMNKGYNILLDK